MTLSDLMLNLKVILPMTVLIVWSCVLLLVDLLIPKERKSWTAVLAAIGLLVFSGWRFLQSRDPQLCTVCERPVHGNTRTEAVVGGAARPYCCPACALSEHTQSGLPVEVLC